jgi:hypothetical protein
MGVKYLNKFLIGQCQKAITLTHMSDVRNKTIVVDTNIYLYKFSMGNSLIENMYLMLSLFEQNNITPIFIFDGKPPSEKKKLIDKRYKERGTAEAEYCELIKKMESQQLSSTKRKELTSKLNILKRKCIHISRSDIEDVRALITSYGFTHIQAPKEADELCSIFVKSGKAWACLSEDMDLLVHGTPRVLRYLSLINQTFVLYDTMSILNYLDVSQAEFVMLCVMCGTDYNTETSNNIHDIFWLFYQYKTRRCSQSFDTWLKSSSECHSQDIQVDTTSVIEHSMKMFTFEDIECRKIVNDAVCFRHKKDIPKVKTILEQDGFIYPQLGVCSV